MGQYYLYGYIDNLGNLVIPYQYISAQDFIDGYACVQDENYRYYYIDKNGVEQSIKAGEGFKGGNSFSNGFAAIHLSGGNPYPPLIPNDVIPEVWTYIDETGNRATDKTYEYAGLFSTDYAITVNNKVGVIDKDFNTVISHEYNDIRICEGYSLFVVNNGSKWGVIDSNENTIIDFKYQEYSGFGDGLFCFKRVQTMDM